jgi:hypothetical protein
MKLNVRKATWALAFAVGIAAAGSPHFLAAQSEQGMEHGKGHDKDKHDQGNNDKDKHDQGNNNDNRNDYSNTANASNRFFQQGVSQGQYDRQKNRGRKYRSNPRDGNDRQAYQSGYDQGYSNNQNTYGQYSQNSQHAQNGVFGNTQYGNNNNNPGFRMGSQDGTNDGRSDRAAGRPLKYGPGYNHPDRGYNNSYGDKNAYQQQYKVGYQQAYQQAFNGRSFGR